MADVRVGEWSGVENRRHKRVSVKIPIECRGDAGMVQADSENISISGLLVRAADPFPQDTEITVAFTLPGSASRVSSRARVAHVVPGIFMGVEFLDVSAESRAEIERFIASAVAVVHAS